MMTVEITDQLAEETRVDHYVRCVRPEWVNRWPSCLLAR